MADYGTLFTLMLVALTFVIVGMCFIVYIMIIGEREKRVKSAMGLSPQEEKLNEECAHQFGYLSGYPPGQPIPEECFGCANAAECMRQTAGAEKADMADSSEQS
jgi:hypothetical protein